MGNRRKRSSGKKASPKKTESEPPQPDVLQFKYGIRKLSHFVVT